MLHVRQNMPFLWTFSFRKKNGSLLSKPSELNSQERKLNSYHCVHFDEIDLKFSDKIGLKKIYFSYRAGKMYLETCFDI